MTTIEAIQELKWVKTHGFVSNKEIVETDRILNALDIGIRAIESSIPKQVNYREYTPAKCPICGENLSESLGDGYYKHWENLDVCPNPDCRQRLKWKEEE